MRKSPEKHQAPLPGLVKKNTGRAGRTGWRVAEEWVGEQAGRERRKEVIATWPGPPSQDDVSGCACDPTCESPHVGGRAPHLGRPWKFGFASRSAGHGCVPTGPEGPDRRACSCTPSLRCSKPCDLEREGSSAGVGS